MKQPYFSLVIPVYNAEKTINKTIESIKQQTFENFEAILVNDGSTDSTQEIIQTQIEGSDQFQLINIENNGPGAARNVGISRASGKYLVLSDADDYLEKNTLISRYEMIADQEYDLLIGSYKTYILDNEEVVSERTTIAPERMYHNNHSFLDDVLSLMEKQLLYVVWNKVYKLDIIKKYAIKFPDYRSCEDRLFNLAYFKRVNKVKSTNNVIHEYYFEGKDSLTNRHFDNKFETFVEFYKECDKLVPEDIEGFSDLFLKGVMSSIIPIHSVVTMGFKDKIRYIQNILKNPYVIKASRLSKKNTMMRKVLSVLFRVKSSLCVYIVSKLLFALSNLSPKQIEKIKGNF